jgi:superfamily II DNA helicase RecQ
MGRSGDVKGALESELGVGFETAFGQRAGQVESVAGQMARAGLANDLGRQLVETVGENVDRNPRLTPQMFRETRLGRMRQWDGATGDPETTDRIVENLIGLGAFSPATVQELPQPPAPSRPTGPATRSPTPAAGQSRAPQSATAPRTAPAQPALAPDPAVFGRLRDWRLNVAQQEGRKAFYVFPDATLQRIAAAQPQTLEELEAVKGVGPKKLAQYGQDVLGVVRGQASGTEDTK